MSRVGDPPHGIEASQDHDDKEKREERREKREERRGKRADGPQEAARGPEMKPPEGDQPFPTPSRLKSEEDRQLESLHFKGGS